MARKSKAQTEAAEELKVEEAMPETIHVSEPKEEHKEGNRTDELEAIVKELSSLVNELKERIAVLEKNAPKRLTSADFCGM